MQLDCMCCSLAKHVGTGEAETACRIGLRTVCASALHPGCRVGVDELLQIMEHPASNAVYLMLKRPDKKHVTGTAYDDSNFFEQTVCDMTTAVLGDSWNAWLHGSSEASSPSNSMTCLLRSTPEAGT